MSNYEAARFKNISRNIFIFVLMSYSIVITLMGLISVNVHLFLLGSILMLGNYFYSVVKEERLRRIKLKEFENDLRDSGRLN